MKPSFSPDKVKQTSWHEYVLRFVFGGCVSAAAAFVVEHYGPAVGGLFLAFPALLPASLTLIKQHDGRKAAADDARGAILGSVGLFVFAVLVACLATRMHPVVTLALATVAWLLVSATLWALLFGRKRA